MPEKRHASPHVGKQAQRSASRPQTFSFFGHSITPLYFSSGKTIVFSAQNLYD